MPTRAGRVKAGRFISGHRRLGLDTAEHDGKLVGLGPAFLLSIPGLAFGRSYCHQGHGSLSSRLRAAATSGSKHRRCKVHSELAR
jgi:hypothetical protein